MSDLATLLEKNNFDKKVIRSLKTRFDSASIKIAKISQLREFVPDKKERIRLLRVVGNENLRKKKKAKTESSQSGKRIKDDKEPEKAAAQEPNRDIKTIKIDTPPVNEAAKENIPKTKKIMTRKVKVVKKKLDDDLGGLLGFLSDIGSKDKAQPSNKRTSNWLMDSLSQTDKKSEDEIKTDLRKKIRRKTKPEASRPETSRPAKEQQESSRSRDAREPGTAETGDVAKQARKEAAREKAKPAPRIKAEAFGNLLDFLLESDHEKPTKSEDESDAGPKEATKEGAKRTAKKSSELEPSKKAMSLLGISRRSELGKIGVKKKKAQASAGLKIKLQEEKAMVDKLAEDKNSYAKKLQKQKEKTSELQKRLNSKLEKSGSSFETENEKRVRKEEAMKLEEELMKQKKISEKLEKDSNAVHERLESQQRKMMMIQQTLENEMERILKEKEDERIKNEEKIAIIKKEAEERLKDAMSNSVQKMAEIEENIRKEMEQKAKEKMFENSAELAKARSDTRKMKFMQEQHEKELRQAIHAAQSKAKSEELEKQKELLEAEYRKIHEEKQRIQAESMEKIKKEAEERIRMAIKDSEKKINESEKLKRMLEEQNRKKLFQEAKLQREEKIRASANEQLKMAEEQLKRAEERVKKAEEAAETRLKQLVVSHEIQNEISEDKKILEKLSANKGNSKDIVLEKERLRLEEKIRSLEETLNKVAVDFNLFQKTDIPEAENKKQIYFFKEHHEKFAEEEKKEIEHIKERRRELNVKLVESKAARDIAKLNFEIDKTASSKISLGNMKIDSFKVQLKDLEFAQEKLIEKLKQKYGLDKEEKDSSKGPLHPPIAEIKKDENYLKKAMAGRRNLIDESDSVFDSDEYELVSEYEEVEVEEGEELGSEYEEVEEEDSFDELDDHEEEPDEKSRQ